MEKINKNDFIEIEFTGKSNNQVFDTTNPDEAKKIGLHNPEMVNPLIISVGNQMILKGLDEELEGKELNKEYSVYLTPEKAFGKRNPGLVKTYSLNNFKKQNINPYPGLVLQLDNVIARIISVSGGRVTIDFNNPLAGKPVEYTLRIIKKITDDKEKINSLQDFFFKKRFNFEIKEEKNKDKYLKKVIFNEDSNNVKIFLRLFKDKFKKMTDFDFEVKEKDDNNKKEDNKEKFENKDKKEGIEREDNNKEVKNKE
ncbi:MAG: peptidylprolyl isomerase [Nanoarchaeota archaeon]